MVSNKPAHTSELNVIVIRYTIYLLAVATSSLLFFINKCKAGPTLDESRTAADRALRLLDSLGRVNVSARRCHTSLVSLLEEKPGSECVSVGSSRLSPRSRFMIEIGAMNAGDE